MSKAKIRGTKEAWESGELGRDEKYVKVSNFSPDDLNDSLGLQMISIRMQKELLDDLKFLAAYHEIGYQPLMKQILRRFVDCEMKAIARECMTKGDAASSNDEEGDESVKMYAY